MCRGVSEAVLIAKLSSPICQPESVFVCQPKLMPETSYKILMAEGDLYMPCFFPSINGPDHFEKA